jgi:hypothetical protein
MNHQQPPAQLTLFPSRDSVQTVFEEARAQLPITTENQLIALLQLHQNTLIRAIEKQPRSARSARTDNPEEAT